ncbi:Cu(I)-responsive transcriptional regulator [Leptospira bouyouniensis]|uniref:Cu(I)-responsive transcriptional regulator n=1 Tax=Leptospira bouyouniensis TaxID=2484911 RepID=A0A7I0IQ34_9LEPT|nr:Cu(I)-responsive transcriptional regulator [Leptospira bouyouniensis]TGL06650.1 Cu(I)-responsive transcriptional regulator [Leptospira bouyouniensis]
MNIGELSKSSGVNAKLIRHYESIGLIPETRRNENGYRMYSEDDVHFVRFIKRSRELGFSLEDIKSLIGLWKNKSRSSKQVKQLAEKHLEELNLKLKQIKDMADTLKHLVHNCHGDHRPDCPILKKLETET